MQNALSQALRSKTSQAPSLIRSEAALQRTLEPRITRRMSKMKSVAESTVGKCVICLGNYLDNFGKLPCGHIYCMECVKKWWRNHPNCPFCRQQIICITDKHEKVIYFQDLPPIDKKQGDQDFVAYCELCWGSVEEYEQMNICTNCRSVYWHSRCLPFHSNKWYCLECAGPEQSPQ